MDGAMAGKSAGSQIRSANPAPTTDSGPPVREALKAAELVKVYPGSSKPALRNFSVTIQVGEIYGLLGPNGAGKTTAISIMSTILRPTSGKVTVCGLDGVQDPARVRKLIGLVPQDIALYPELTARENLAFFGRIQGLGGSALKTRIGEALETVSLADRADQRVATYSGGMKRRANLAVGILNRPRVLFLDEPTVGIDAQSRNLILEKLARLKDDGITMVYTTHYMEEAQRLCSRVAIIDEGLIVAEAPPTELVARHQNCCDLGEVFLGLTGKRLRD